MTLLSTLLGQVWLSFHLGKQCRHWSAAPDDNFDLGLHTVYPEMLLVSVFKVNMFKI